jgi:hypothetical protein
VKLTFLCNITINLCENLEDLYKGVVGYMYMSKMDFAITIYIIFMVGATFVSFKFGSVRIFNKTTKRGGKYVLVNIRSNTCNHYCHT